MTKSTGWEKLGRVVFGGYFLYNAVNHFRNHKQLAQYADAKHVPKPHAAVVGSGAMMAAGSVGILTGLAPRTGALLIALFLAGVSPTMHAFWKEQGEAKVNDQINFMKNLALLGGALLAAAAIDQRRRLAA